MNTENGEAVPMAAIWPHLDMRYREALLICVGIEPNPSGGPVDFHSPRYVAGKAWALLPEPIRAAVVAHYQGVKA